mgnify:CR=1 FL=1
MADEKRLAYYCSREWSLKKKAIHARSGGMCERCDENKGEAVHHKTYARLYNEDLEDLIHLCNKCHDFQHGNSDFDPAAPVTYETDQIKISSEEHGLDQSVLCCPHCHHDYIHSEKVITYERNEDEDYVNKTTVDCETTTEKILNEGSGNPSKRRHGLTIQFWCEGCTAISKLHIVQHKGITYLNWTITTHANLRNKL